MTSRFSYRFTNASTSRAARLIVFVLLGCMVACIVGLPVPPPAKNTAGTELFPCINSPCGCKTAAQCWDHCCCYNDAQKIAWAEEHDVVPPAFVVARHDAAQKTTAQKNATLLANSEPSCCSEKQSCCSDPAVAAKVPPVVNSKVSDKVADNGRRDCCRTDKPSTEKQNLAKTESTKGSRVVFWNAVQRCRGIDLVWTLLATGWIPDRQEPIKVPDPLLIETYVIEDTNSESIIIAPDPPVPWLPPAV